MERDDYLELRHEAMQVETCYYLAAVEWLHDDNQHALYDTSYGAEQWVREELEHAFAPYTADYVRKLNFPPEGFDCWYIAEGECCAWVKKIELQS